MIMKTVYYLVHHESNRRIRYYTTLTGARIACRLRNLHLGFIDRIKYEDADDRTYELCVNLNADQVCGTYAIEEDTIESPDLTC